MQRTAAPLCSLPDPPLPAVPPPAAGLFTAASKAAPALARSFTEGSSVSLFVPTLLKGNHFSIMSNSITEENMQKACKMPHLITRSRGDWTRSRLRSVLPSPFLRAGLDPLGNPPLPGEMASSNFDVN